MRVVVTGANGFLGRHIMRRLPEFGADAVGGTRRPVAGMRSVALDITDAASADAALRAEKPTHVINCAAYGVDQSRQSYPDAFAVNVEACAIMLEACARAGVRRFVQVGTCSEYAGSETPIAEDAPQRPHNLYAVTKAAGTRLALALAGKLGIEVVVVRPFFMWGPYEPAHRIIPAIVAACRAKQPLALTDCELMRDYSFAADAAGWMARVALSDKVRSGDIVNIGSGRPVLLRDFALEFSSRLGGTDLMRFGERPQRPNEPKSVVADVSRLVGLIGPLAHTSIDDGLRQMLDASAP